MTIGELIVSLLLDGDVTCYDCSLMLIRQCLQLFTQHFYAYAQPRASKTSDGRLVNTAMAASIKEAAVFMVSSGEKATLEDAVEELGFNRQQARPIFADSWTAAMQQ